MRAASRVETCDTSSTTTVVLGATRLPSRSSAKRAIVQASTPTLPSSATALFVVATATTRRPAVWLAVAARVQCAGLAVPSRREQHPQRRAWSAQRAYCGALVVAESRFGVDRGVDERGVVRARAHFGERVEFAQDVVFELSVRDGRPSGGLPPRVGGEPHDLLGGEELEREFGDLLDGEPAGGLGGDVGDNVGGTEACLVRAQARVGIDQRGERLSAASVGVRAVLGA